MATQNTTPAMNEAMKHLNLLIEQVRKYESAADATGMSILMQPIKGTGLAPMLTSVKQPDR
jgi:hypothetical protein